MKFQVPPLNAYVIFWQFSIKILGAFLMSCRRKLERIFASLHQDDVLLVNWEIEHILPQRWQSSYFSSAPDAEVKELVEHIGNKIPFESNYYETTLRPPSLQGNTIPAPSIGWLYGCCHQQQTGKIHSPFG
jgi:hypothetical protein